MEENNKLKKFDNESLPSFFKELSEEQQKHYLDKLAQDNAELKRIASEKVIKSKLAEHDMANDIEFLKQIETENKVVSIKREYDTGSGKLELNIKGGDKKFLIPLLIITGITLLLTLLIIFQ